MNLYIEIENGVPKNHPAFEENLISAFGKVPDGWEPFLRTEPPPTPVYKLVPNPPSVYQKINGVWTDVWQFRDMTVEEKTAYQNEVKNMWATRPQAENFAAWTFDETICNFVPPIPRPQEPKEYFWQGTTFSWVERPPYPTDGKKYRLNFTLGVWQEVEA